MNQYFATLPVDELIKELEMKKDAYYAWLRDSYRLARWRMAYDTYYGQRGRHNSSHISAGGDQGELSFLMSNEYRNLVQHLVVLTTQNKPNIECAAANTDKTSQDQCILGKQLLDYYNVEARLGQNAKLALETSLIMDHSWVFTDWDLNKGVELRPDEQGQVLTDGDVTSRTRTPLDVVFDYTTDSGNDFPWQMWRDLVNKYDLAAQYPEKAEEILSIQRDRSKDLLYRFGDQAYYGVQSNDSPLIERWSFVHKSTPSIKGGRLVQFLDAKVHLFDGPSPYRRLPGRRCCPTEMIMSAFGYSNTNDLISLQDSLDALVSAAVTNMTSCGVNNIWVKPNSNIDFESLGEGMNYIESEDKPEVLMLNRLPPEWFNLSNWIISRMEAYSGVNSVARGNTEGKDLSGAAMALLQSMAIQFNSGMQQAYNQLIEDINNDTLSLLQDYAKEPKVALIAGVSNQNMAKSFSNKDIKDIRRVFVRQSNSIENTTAGKLTIAKDLMQVPGVITRADQYLQVLRTGSLDPLVEDNQKELLAIRGENEALSRGEPVMAVFTENHPKHLQYHASVLWDAESKNDPQLVENVRMHIEQTLQVWQSTDPVILMALNIPPFPAAMMPPQGPIPQGGDPALQPPPEAVGAQPEPGMPGEPGMPNFPINPMTGEQNPAQGA